MSKETTIDQAKSLTKGSCTIEPNYSALHRLEAAKKPKKAGAENSMCSSTGIEPVRGDPIWFRVKRLNHSATTAPLTLAGRRTDRGRGGPAIAPALARLRVNSDLWGCTCFGSTYTKIGTIQRRLAWPLRKDDTQNREAFHIFWLHYLYLSIDAIWFDVYFSKFWKMSQNLQIFESLEGSTHAGSNQVPIHICLVLNLSVDLMVVRYVLTLQWIIFETL